MTRCHLRPLLATAVAAGLVACAGIVPKASSVDPATQEVLSTMSAKLASAQTLRFSGTRAAPSGFHAAVDFGEKTHMNGALRRPNHIVVNFDSAEGNRMLGYDGAQLVLVDRKAHTHVKSPAPPTGEAVLRAIDRSYNFIPPAAEFLVSDPQAYLQEGVLSVRHAGQETIEGVPCDHLFFQQQNRTRDLWVAKSDHLPRRITITYPNGGATPLAVTTTIHRWQINAPVTDADVAIKIPADSTELESIPLRR